MLPATVPTEPPGKYLNFYIGSLTTLIPNLKTFETPITLRATSLIDAFVWNCIAAYSSSWHDALRPGSRPIIGNIPEEAEGQTFHTSDARALCMAHGLGVLIAELTPESASAFEQFVNGFGLQVGRKASPDLVACLGSNFASADRSCFESLAASAGFAPSSVGPALALHVLAYAREDGWNADGREGCTANCRPFSDTTGYPRHHEGGKATSSLWQPLLEDNGKGFFFRQSHVVPHIGFKAKPRIADEKLMKRTLADPEYDYEKEADLVISRLAKLTEEQKMLIEFFDDKIDVALTALKGLMMKFPKSTTFERAAFFFVGFTGIEHDATVLTWKEKVRHDLVRTTTVVQSRGEQEISTYAGPFQGTKAFEAKDFQPYIRVMPHAEYPSGSGCLCTAMMEYTDAFQAYVYGDSSPLATKVPLKAGSSKIEPGMTPAQDVTLQFASMEESRNACGKSRLDGGMHFTAAVPDSYRLCSGLGEAAVAYVKKLEQGVKV